jgi:hypothetical protein
MNDFVLDDVIYNGRYVENVQLKGTEIRIMMHRGHNSATHWTYTEKVPGGAAEVYRRLKQELIPSIPTVYPATETKEDQRV